MVTITIYHYLVLATILFSLGVIGILIRRNIIIVLMCVELMLNAANIVFIAFSRFHMNMDGQVISIFIMALAAAEAAVGLAIATMLFRKSGHIDMDHFNILKG